MIRQTHRDPLTAPTASRAHLAAMRLPEFREGVEAKEQGATKRANPYFAGSLAHTLWDCGWTGTANLMP